MMEDLLEDPGLASAHETIANAVETAADAVEAVLGNQTLDSFRQWIESQQDITWLTDDEFLGAFSRLSAGDNDEARNRLQKLLSSQKKYPQWFENLDSTDPKIQQVFNEGLLLLLPERDDNGKNIYIVRFGMDSNSIDTESWIRAMVVFSNYLFLINYKDEAGTVAILDFAGATFESFDAVMSLDTISEWCQIVASHYPIRVTDVHYIHCDEQIKEKTVEAIKKPFSAETMEHKVHSETLEELYKEVPMRCLPVEYLPADYTGPNAGTFQQLIEYTKSTLTSPEVRDRIAQLSHDQWSIGETQQTSIESPSTTDDV